MQTFQLLTVGVGTAITLGMSSSAVWGNPSGIVQEAVPLSQPSDWRALAIGQPTPMAPTPLGSVQFLTATHLTSTKLPTALIAPLLKPALLSFEVTASPSELSSQSVLPVINHSLTLAAIADGVAPPATQAEADEGIPPRAGLTPANLAIPEITAPTPVPTPLVPVGNRQISVPTEAGQPQATTIEVRAAVPETIPLAMEAKAAHSEVMPTVAPSVDAVSHAEVLETDGVDVPPEPEAALPAGPTTAPPIGVSLSPQSGTPAPNLDAQQTTLAVSLARTVDAPDAPGTAEEETIRETEEAALANEPVEEPSTAVGETGREPETAPAIADTPEAPEAGTPVTSEDVDTGEVPEAATPDSEVAIPARLAEADPAPVPATEFPTARELQQTQTGDAPAQMLRERAEVINPKAVSVNEPRDSQGPLPELNPNPDRLYLPNKPEEVQIQLTQPINLRQAVEQALSNNLTLQDAQLRLDRSRAQLREAQAAWHPTVSLQSVLQRVDSASTERTNRLRARNPSPLNALLGTADTVTRTFTGRVGIDWAVFTSGRRMANIRAARQQIRISELEVKRQTDAIILDVSNSYFDLQEADAQVEIAKAAVNSAQQSLRDAQLQFDAGVGTRFDVLRAEVQLANEKQNLTNRLAQQQVARRQLSQQLNVPQTVSLVASDQVEVAGTWQLTLEETIIQAYENRPNLEQRLAERELRRQQRRAELAATLPQLNAFADYDVLKNLDDGIGLTDGNTVGVRLDWRLYDGGAARARARQRAIEAEIAEVGFADIRNQIRLEVERAYSSLLSNFENIDTARLAVDQAEEALRLARLRFQAGVGTQTEVINSETDLTNARGNLLQAVINYNRSLATLERAVSLPIAESQTINNEGRGIPVNGGGRGS